MSRSLLLAAVSSMCILGCGTSPLGGGGPDSGVPPAASLSVTPTAQRLTAGSGAVNLRATLVAGTGPIVWTLSGPGTLGATSGEQSSYTPPATVDTETAVTVTASAAPALSATVSITVVASAAIEVRGRVVGLPGNGLPGVTVAIGAKTTVTDPDGRFSIPGVTPPYDLALVEPGTPPMGGLFHGLTRPDPTLVAMFFDGPGTPSTGVVSGRVSGGDPIPSDGEFTGGVFASPEANGRLTLSSRDYALPISWFGPTTTIGTMHVLQWKSPGPGRVPTAYTGFGTVTAVRVTDGQANNDASIQLFDPGTAAIAGNVVALPGSGIIEKSLALEFSDHAILPLGTEAGADGGFSFAIPGNVTLTAVVTAAAKVGAENTFRRESGIARGATDVSIHLPMPASPSTPASGSTGISTSTDFAWNLVAGGVHLVIFNGPGNKPSYFVVTTEASTRIPDLAALGAPLPAASSYSWFVVRYAPFASVDEYTGTGFLLPPVGSVEGSISESFRVTTR